MKNKCKTINRILNDDIKRNIGKKIKDRGIINHVHISNKIYLPILLRIRQIVDFNNILKF